MTDHGSTPLRTATDIKRQLSLSIVRIQHSKSAAWRLPDHKTEMRFTSPGMELSARRQQSQKGRQQKQTSLGSGRLRNMNGVQVASHYPEL
jgi:hypothetical protein